MQLSGITVQCIRGFTNKASISLKPLTLLVGANSSGKSSLLRLFPLLRQSFETRTKGPFLWYGPYVDFGSFNDARSRGAGDNDSSIGFKFQLEPSPHQPEWNGYDPYRLHAYRILDEISLEVTVRISSAGESGETYLSSIIANLDGELIEVRLRPDGVASEYLVNSSDHLSPSFVLSLSQGLSLFSLNCTRKDAGKNKSIDHLNRAIFNPIRGISPTKELLTHIDCLFHGNTDQLTKQYFAENLGIGSLQALHKQLAVLALITKTSSRNAAHYSADPSWLKRLHELIIANKLPLVLSDVDNFLCATLKRISYMGPLRATASRYYRQQDLATDEVDPEGANLAMFLSGLSKTDQDRFSSWCSEEMGFKININPSVNHVSIEIEAPEEKRFYNIADMGFGYSQLMPVLALIWCSLRPRAMGDSNDKTAQPLSFYRFINLQSLDRIIAIEQPELHLHPRLQARLANLYCKVARASVNSGSGVKLLIETHSETIINRVGRMVYEKVIDPSDVQVLVVSKTGTSSQIDLASFDESGCLNNWPHGFFLPDDEC